MSSPSELLTVIGRKKPVQDVTSRDFQKPLRMGKARHDELSLALKNQMPGLEKRLLETTGLRLELALDGLGEVDAEGIFAHPGEPPCVLRFLCNKAPAWLVWESSAATLAIETLFGSRAAATVARKLSPTEAKIAGQLLAQIAEGIASALGLAATNPTFVQIATELGSWRDAGSDAESHRLEVRLQASLAGQPSPLALYLPGVDLGCEPARLPVPDTLPQHLERIEVELSACLPGSEISLDQLLALEAGDVIPLEARLGDSTSLCVEGMTLARARLGSHRGRLAVRIEHMDFQPETVL